MLQVAFPAWILVFSFAFLAASSQDCDHTLRGLVEDTHGENLPGATIIMESTEQGTVTDVNGMFALTKLCPSQ